MKPKFTCLALALLLCLSVTTYAQVGRVKNIYLGLSVAPIQNLDETFLNANHYTYKAGIDFKYRFTKRLCLTSGLFLQNYVSKFSLSTSAFSETTKFSSSTIQIPLRLDIRLRRKIVSPFITAGFLYNFISFEKSKYSSTGVYPDPSFSRRSSTLLSNPAGQLGFGLDVTNKWVKFQLYPFYEATYIRGGVNNFANSLTHSVGLALSLLVSL